MYLIAGFSDDGTTADAVKQEYYEQQGWVTDIYPD